MYKCIVKSIIVLASGIMVLPLFSPQAFAENIISVERIVAQPTDLSAQGNSVKDLKGKPCALLKVYGADNLAGLDADNMGAAMKRGREIWINLTDGAEAIDLTFADAEPMHIAFKDFGIDRLKSASTYLLILDKESVTSDDMSDEDGMSADFREGLKYYYGLGKTKQDYKKARQFLLKAAENGDTDAQYYLGMMSLLGIAGEKDSKLAYEWLSAAARRGHPDATLELARMYQSLNSPKYDDEMAFAFFNKSAEAGNPEAMVELGYYYGKGLYVAEDQAKSLQLFKEAAEHGNTLAQHNLALKYYNGDGVPKDRKKAFELFEKAADAGDPFAQCNLGIMYENGIGVEKDMDKALRYYRKASAQGNDKATSALILLGE